MTRAFWWLALRRHSAKVSSLLLAMAQSSLEETAFLISSVMLRASLIAQSVKNLPAMQETWVQSLNQEDPLEKEMATHSSIPCLENPMDREAWWATVHRVAKGRHD